MLEYRKMYIDTRHVAEGTSNEFSIELPTTVTLPENTIYYITDINIPHVWKTVEKDWNDKLYVASITPAAAPEDPCNVEVKEVIVTPGNYTASTLAPQLAAALTVAYSGVTWTVTPDQNTNSLSISWDYAGDDGYMKFLTDKELRQRSFLYLDGDDSTAQANVTLNYDVTNLMTMNGILKNASAPWFQSIIRRTGIPGATPWQIDFLDLHNIRNIYITSPNFGNFDTLSLQGMPDGIVKKIPVTQGFGFMISQVGSDSHDFRDCSKQTLKTLDFRLVDGANRLVPLKGSHVSFSIIFSKYHP
jgi:hypothetical protein